VGLNADVKGNNRITLKKEVEGFARNAREETPGFANIIQTRKFAESEKIR